MNIACGVNLKWIQIANAQRDCSPKRVLTSPTCKEVEMASVHICSVDDCGKRVVARGWCGAHYNRWRLHGTPLGSSQKKLGPAQEWIETVAVPYKGNDCLTWPFYRAPDGYGRIDVDGQPHVASRVICERVHGKPPSPQHVAAHSCLMGHLGCVSPIHLRWATQSENEQDKLKSGTSNRGSQHGMSKLTADDVRAIRQLAGVMPQDAIGAKFGVSKWTVGDIIRRKRWGWLA